MKYLIFITSLFFLWNSTLNLKANQPLNILFVLHEFPKFNQPFILNQITGLIDRGHNVKIFANFKRMNIIPEAFRKYNLLAKTYYRALPSQVNKFDIIYCHFGIDGYIGLHFRQMGVSGKVVTCFRGDDISQFLHQGFEKENLRYRGTFKIPCYFPQMYDELFLKGDLFLPVCEYFARKIKWLGCSPKKIIVHHSAIHIDDYPYLKREIKNNEIRIMTSGRLVELKGTKYLILAFARLVKKYNHKYRLKLIIVGDGPLRNYLKKLVERLKIKKNVQFLGFVPHEKLSRLLLKCDIFSLPSITTADGNEEGIPNALMEAMATGMPVVATHHSGIPELIKDGVSGFLVEERNHYQLFEKLDYLIINPKIWPKMGKKGRKYVLREHNIEQENKNLEEIFYTLLEEHTNANLATK